MERLEPCHWGLQQGRVVEDVGHVVSQRHHQSRDREQGVRDHQVPVLVQNQSVHLVGVVIERLLESTDRVVPREKHDRLAKVRRPNHFEGGRIALPRVENLVFIEFQWSYLDFVTVISKVFLDGFHVDDNVVAVVHEPAEEGDVVGDTERKRAANLLNIFTMEMAWLVPRIIVVARMRAPFASLHLRMRMSKIERFISYYR